MANAAQRSAAKFTNSAFDAENVREVSRILNVRHRGLIKFSRNERN